MKRYLIYFSYNGTRFSGVQKLKNQNIIDNSIARHLENSLRSLNPLNDPLVYNSSRTDAGVHAISSTFHSDLSLHPFKIKKHRCDLVTQEDFIAHYMNKYFQTSSLDIRIQKAVQVPNHFHCRFSASHRTYLFRLAQCRLPFSYKFGLFDHNSDVLPITELHKCQVIRGDFDVESAKRACAIIKAGTDFRYFAKIPPELRQIQKTERKLIECKIVPGRPLVNASYDPLYEDLTFWDVVVSSRAFLYNQVRRIVAVLIGVGQGNLSLDQVRSYFSDPNQSWDRSLVVAEPCGLYLLNVHYPPEAFLDEASLPQSAMESEE